MDSRPERHVRLSDLNAFAKQTEKRSNEVYEKMIAVANAGLRDEREQEIVVAVLDLAQEVRSLGQQMQDAVRVLSELY